ncbi:hypothetical protein POM99_13330 [Novosphingobium sp. HBC54]|uniref:Uncharacterized protein n=2 Tax=Novosphingobium cyanobacteriorum TaxID=3024215 RepID=A0ABT6CJU1_9SPHN|nr:hypothetical protein [Novosphingobium cyanobacteriorum]
MTLAGLVALIPAFLFSQMAIADNNQGEFVDLATDTYTASLYQLFAISWMAAFAPLALLLLLIALASRSRSR